MKGICIPKSGVCIVADLSKHCLLLSVLRHLLLCESLGIVGVPCEWKRVIGVLRMLLMVNILPDIIPIGELGSI